MSGLFISFEGVDGCGKSTQMRFARQYLESRGIDPLVTREPGGCGIAERIREILLDPANADMDPYAEALLYAAARAQHVSEVIVPALEAGRVVLTDRFLDSSLAYQGAGRGLGAGTVMDINRHAVHGVFPDATIFLDFPPELAFRRMSSRKKHDRLEEEGAVFYKKLYDGFVDLCQRYPERIVRIDASGPKEATREKVRSALRRILRERPPEGTARA